MDIPLHASPEHAAAARDIAERFGFALSDRCDHPYYLAFTGERLELRQGGPDAPGPIFVDFVGGAVGHRRRFGGGRGQPIAKAAGLKAGMSPRVVDATAGLGRDAFVLASLGCEVTLVERSAVAAALLADGMRRGALDAETAPILARMTLVHAQAVPWLRGLAEEERPDVVYLDPMFPHREKSALVKKEMRAFQAVIGADEDADALLDVALAAARRRVVVKRPKGAPFLAGRGPTLDYPTKNHRFDVYVLAGFPSTAEKKKP
ncbi:MAG: class I SAM-dependent methyltransferase [Thiohalomonadaceae bacterium]